MTARLFSPARRRSPVAQPPAWVASDFQLKGLGPGCILHGAQNACDLRFSAGYWES